MEDSLEDQLWIYNWVRYGVIEDLYRTTVWEIMEEYDLADEDEAIDFANEFLVAEWWELPPRE